MSLWVELKRRNVVRVALAYTVTAWVITEVSSLVLDIFGADESISRIIITLLAMGLPVALLFAWAFEVTPEGIKRESEVEHDSPAAQQQAKRLDILTIGMVVLAIALLAADRFVGRPAPTSEPTGVVTADSTPEPDTGESEPGRDATWAARQIIEVRRLADMGMDRQAMALAREVAAVLPEVNEQESFWSGFSFSIDIDSEPAGASVWRQDFNAPPEEWEYLGETPIEKVRFVPWAASRVRFELEGHGTVTMLQEALMGPDRPYGFNALNPAVLEPVDQVPADMVRLPGFTRDLVQYGPYYMARFEVTNREYAEFITAGGYDSPQYWTEPFLRDGEEVPFEDAVAEFTDRTGRPGPATWEGGAWPSGRGDHPVNGISWFEAVAYARFRDRILPTYVHQRMALRLYNINSGVISVASNFGSGGTRPVGENRAMSSLGIYDNVGNVREWCWNEMGEGDRCSFGTSWADIPYMADDASPKSPWDRSEEHGIRLALAGDDEARLARLREPMKHRYIRDFSQETPASDSEYEILKRFYTYDELPLNAEVADSVETELWRRERVEFDLPSGERGAAFLFIPAMGQAPYSTVMFWPGSDMINRRSIEDATTSYMDFLIKGGHMVAWPVYKGSLDRDDPDKPITASNQWGPHDSPANSYYRDLVVTWVQELSRTIDYLETRPDLYNGQLGYYGVSWGGFRAPVPLAVEVDRFDAAVLVVAGLNATSKFLPETDSFNFVTRVRAPTLMINGEYDAVAPKVFEGQPLYDWLGTDPEHKKMILAPTSHFIPRELMIRETLNWFDEYLGK